MNGNQALPPLGVLSKDMEAEGISVPDVEWQIFADECTSTKYAKKDTVFETDAIADHMLFVTNGISASQFAHPNGQLTIERFFEAGDFCTAVRSAWRTEPSDDQILAVTPLEGVLIPMKRWRDEYLRGGAIGEYIRIKIFQTLLFDADVIRVKSLNRTRESYTFLQKRQPGVLRSVAQKDVAQFLGITPEGLSRFLRNTVTD
ncbi:MAG: hypothetical protein AAGC77_10330 [Pseudomonadota bacterium]